jgi:hypothetical protein
MGIEYEVGVLFLYERVAGETGMILKTTVACYGSIRRWGRLLLVCFDTQ